MQLLLSNSRRFLLNVLNRPFNETRCEGGKKAAEKGLTLIEIIIVVAILGSIMALLIPQILERQRVAQMDQAKLAMSMIDQDLTLYRLHNGRYPTTEEGLDALVRAPGDAKNWKGPYCDEQKLMDPWQTKYTYESDGRSRKIMSPGPDGQLGTTDDVVYPDQPASSAPQG